MEKIEEPIVFKLIGTTAQILEISIEPEKTFLADGGMLLYLDEEIVHETRPDDGYQAPQEEIADDYEDFLDEEEPILPEKEVDLMPDVVALPTKQNAIVEDDEETEGTFLEKLWKATRKTIANIGKKKEEETPKPITKPEPEPTPSFGGIFEEPINFPEPKSEPPTPKEPEFSWYITHLHNPSEYIRKVGFTTTHGGLVVPVVLDELQENCVIFQTGTFLCARKGIRLEKFLDTGISVNFTQGKLFKLDKITGGGMIFLRGEGQVIRREMENDAIRINLFSILAYESTLTLDTGKVSLIDAMNYEDQTQFVLLSGTGKYWLQTANLQHLVYRLAPVVFEPEPEVKEQEAVFIPKPEKEESPAPSKEETDELSKALLESPTSKEKGGDDEPDLDIDKIVDEL
jgi:uncharacterized protein (AIM24 family)